MFYVIGHVFFFCFYVVGGVARTIHDSQFDRMALIHDRELTADRANDVATARAAMKDDLVGVNTKDGSVLLDPFNTSNYIHSHLFSGDSGRCEAVLYVENDAVCFDCRVAS